MDLDERIYVTLLLDTYGGLLTERQRTVLHLIYEEDLSLSEIAELTGVSRAAVLDTKARAEKLLLWYEDALKVVQSASRRREALEELNERLEKSMSRLGRDDPDLVSAARMVKDLLAGELDGL
ncbi:MAG TPA: DNA-binding protein [Clostridia bacterium]|nr:DNA-binding protein [Clostridia bacterium]